jgi:hypothetical protein
MIENPDARFVPRVEIGIVRYMIGLRDWRRAAES